MTNYEKLYLKVKELEKKSKKNLINKFEKILEKYPLHTFMNSREFEKAIKEIYTKSNSDSKFLKKEVDKIENEINQLEKEDEPNE